MTAYVHTDSTFTVRVQHDQDRLKGKGFPVVERKKRCPDMCAYSTARDYGKWLETQPEVEAFEVGKVLELERLPHVSPTGIRKLYFQTQWCSDFYIRFADGRIGVRELAPSASLAKQAEIEKLELSRRPPKVESSPPQARSDWNSFSPCWMPEMPPSRTSNTGVKSRKTSRSGIPPPPERC